MNCKSFEELTSAASHCLQNMGRSASSIRIYLWTWGRFRKYLDENKIRELSEQVVMGYIEATYGQSDLVKLTHHQKDHLRQCICLVQFDKTGKIPVYINRKPTFPL